MSADDPEAHDDELRRRLDALMPHCYDELRELAAQYLRRERNDHTLQPTAVVHEAYLRLRRSPLPRLEPEARGAFLAAASTTIRHLLVDHARKHKALRRGSGWKRVTLQAGLLTEEPHQLGLLALDEAMTRLAERHPAAAEVVELRVFCDMELQEIGDALGVTRRTIDRRWALGKAWLARELSRGG